MKLKTNTKLLNFLVYSCRHPNFVTLTWIKFYQEITRFKLKKTGIRLGSYINRHRIHLRSFLGIYRVLSHENLMRHVNLVAWPFTCRSEFVAWTCQPCRRGLVAWNLGWHRDVVACKLSHRIPCDMSHEPSVRHVAGAFFTARGVRICL